MCAGVKEVCSFIYLTPLSFWRSRPAEVMAHVQTTYAGSIGAEVHVSSAKERAFLIKVEERVGEAVDRDWMRDNPCSPCSFPV